MISGTEDQLLPAEIHPFRDTSTTVIAPTASKVADTSKNLNNDLCQERCFRGSARWIRSLAKASERSVPAEEVGMKDRSKCHWRMEMFQTIILGSMAQATEELKRRQADEKGCTAKRSQISPPS